MLCLPGFAPVAKLDHAVGDSEGCEDCRGAKLPCSARRFRFGSLPSSMNLRARVGSMPSKPMTKTLPGALRVGLLACGARLQAAARAARARARREVWRNADIGLLELSLRRAEKPTF